MPNVRPSTSLCWCWTARALTAAAAAVFAVTFAAPAYSQDPSPDPGGSAVNQYVELVPTGEGPKSPGVKKERRTPLAPKVKQALDTTPKATADALTTVATSSSYGAPAKPRPRPSPKVLRDAPSPAEKPSLDHTLEATAAAVAPVGNARMIALLVALAAIAVGGGILGATRRRL